MELRTLGRTNWKDIKVGELFAFEGCWTICWKTTEDECMVLDCDYEWYTGKRGEGELFRKQKRKSDKFIPLNCELKHFFGMESNLRSIEYNLYKLSPKIQALWKTE